MTGPRVAAGRGGDVDLQLSEPLPDTAAGVPRRRILVYAGVDPAAQDSAAKIRVSAIVAALGEHADVSLIVGRGLGRAGRALAWLVRRGWRSVDAVYVETPARGFTLLDVLVLRAARGRGKPLGVYFRDAQQLFPAQFPVTGLGGRLRRASWRLTDPMLRRAATVSFVPSEGIARALQLRSPVGLPPACDPDAPDLGIGTPNLVAAIMSIGPGSGFDLLLAAMAKVRDVRPDARLRVLTSLAEAGQATSLPRWVEVVGGSRDALPAALGPARVCVLPTPVTAYADLVVPLRLMEYFAFGKPIVVTDAHETARIVGSTGAGIITSATPDALAEGIGLVLDDPAIASQLAVAARAVGCLPEAAWAARAETILQALLPG